MIPFKISVCQQCGVWREAGYPCPNCDPVIHHETILVDSCLTAKPKGGYVHAMHWRCVRCREDFYLVTNSDNEYHPQHGAHTGAGFATMLTSSPCKTGSVNHAR